MERRRRERLDLSAPVKFAWETDDSTRREGSGVTRNFSAGGLFVMTEDPPPVGATVHLEVDLKTSRLDSTVTIRAKGLVQRIEVTDLIGQLGGFAVSTRRMRLEKPDLSEIG
jgi:c-di-GMP-binding flagellar brake protein YcgR